MQRLWVQVSGLAGIAGGEWMGQWVSPLSILRLRGPWKPIEPPPRTPQHKWLPTARVVSRCVCSLLCVHLRWVKCRAQIPSMGHHTWPDVTSLSFSKYKSPHTYKYKRVYVKLDLCKNLNLNEFYKQWIILNYFHHVMIFLSLWTLTLLILN